MQAINVLFVTHYTQLFGANKSLLNLLNELILKGVKPIVLVPKSGDLIQELERKNIDYIINRFEWDFVASSKYQSFDGIYERLKLIRRNILAALRIAEILKSYNISLIYSNSSVILMGYILSKKLKVPHIWHFREFAELHYGLIPNIGYTLLKSALMNSASSVFVSECLRIYYTSKRLKNSHVVYNGIASKEFILSFKNLQKSHKRDVYVFCIVGLIEPNKGQLEALKAINILRKKHDNVLLKVVGTGNPAELIKYVKEEELANYVEFVGYVNNPFAILEPAFASLMCSRNEAMGRVTVESMCVKTPVIGFSSGGTKELITHENTGLLYNGDENDLAKEMEKLIYDQHLYQYVSENCYALALNNFTQEKYGILIHEIILSNTKIK